MNDLVVLYDGVPMTTSQRIADKFGKNHADVLRAIKNLDCSGNFKVSNYAECFFTNKMNRQYAGYKITRDGFVFLCMGFTGKKAAKFKEDYIAAFNAMERQLLSKANDLEWKQARLQSKATRLSFTDTVKDFVNYCVAQGSKNAHRYYGSITKMEYVALEFLSQKDRVPDNFRDALDSMDLCFLAAAEQVAKLAIKSGMNEGLHYKEIFILAKQKVNIYADTVKIPRIGVNNG